MPSIISRYLPACVCIANSSKGMIIANLIHEAYVVRTRCWPLTLEYRDWRLNAEIFFFSPPKSAYPSDDLRLTEEGEG